MNNYIFEGLIIYAIAWILRLYPDSITIISTLRLVSSDNNKPYINIVIKYLYWVLIIIATVLVSKGVYEIIKFR